MEVTTVRLWVGRWVFGGGGGGGLHDLALGPFGFNWVLDLIGTWLRLGVQRGFGARA